MRILCKGLTIRHSMYPPFGNRKVERRVRERNHMISGERIGNLKMTKDGTNEMYVRPKCLIGIGIKVILKLTHRVLAPLTIG